MGLNLSILYRGPLSSCNYACGYCPFAKRRETADELARDRVALERFVGWIEARAPSDRLGVLFTPWGEALVRPWYRDAMVRLSHLPQVARVAAQTNLSCDLGWLDDCDRTRLALWATFHPSETDRPAFLAKCLDLDRRGVRFSVGVVGLRQHFADIRELSLELPPHIYLWVNAYKDRSDYYGADEVDWLTAIDPLFPVNNRRHPSLGRSCRAGQSVVSVDGGGTMRRCHFIAAPLGNLYDPQFQQALAERPCTNAVCGCHIGYVHMPDLGLYEVFGDGVLERIPARPLQRTRISLDLVRAD
jgi:MoaA/NifB/PqqE/SkfB family radical SAM enzyme